jgi:hypothetical protein
MERNVSTCVTESISFYESNRKWKCDKIYHLLRETLEMKSVTLLKCEKCENYSLVFHSDVPEDS